jgi:hypothetical protein
MICINEIILSESFIESQSRCLFRREYQGDTEFWTPAKQGGSNISDFFKFALRPNPLPLKDGSSILVYLFSLFSLF